MMVIAVILIKIVIGVLFPGLGFLLPAFVVLGAKLLGDGITVVA